VSTTEQIVREVREYNAQAAKAEQARADALAASDPNHTGLREGADVDLWRALRR